MKQILIRIAIELILDWLNENDKTIIDHDPTETEIENLAKKAADGAIGKLVDKLLKKLN